LEQKRRWRWGVNRWIILLLIALGIIAARAFPPVLPHIQLAAERYHHDPLFTLPIIGEFYWTNTLTALIVVDIILLLIALSVYRAVKSGSMVPSGFAGAIEAILEVIYNLTESTTSKWAKRIFPYFATITLMVLVANWMDLIPGVESVGILEAVDYGEPARQLLPGVYTIIPHDDTGSYQGQEYAVVPFLRAASTDLNFTVGLALISVFMTQVIGFRALGWSYFRKFINVAGIAKSPIFGTIDFFVGILELISEISKVLSFSFRLFGNIFAGTVLLFVIGTLVPVFAQSLFLMLELFIGLVQATVFGLLTMVFMALATVGHHSEDEEVAPEHGLGEKVAESVSH
jgi:F-type H+-transporting ATPase subunit a